MNHIPNHRNQQQILRAVTSSGCLSELQQLATLPEYERERLLAIMDLVCTCCIGHNTDVQVRVGVVQGLTHPQCAGCREGTRR